MFYRQILLVVIIAAFSYSFLCMYIYSSFVFCSDPHLSFHARHPTITAGTITKPATRAVVVLTSLSLPAHLPLSYIVPPLPIPSPLPSPLLPHKPTV